VTQSRDQANHIWYRLNLGNPGFQHLIGLNLWPLITAYKSLYIRCVIMALPQTKNRPYLSQDCCLGGGTGGKACHVPSGYSLASVIRPME